MAPTAGGIVTVTGGQVAAGTTSNVIRTDSLAANTYTIEVQRSQAVASSTVGDNGVSHFDSARFTVDSNGFVSTSGTGIGETITGDTGGALSPTAGNWNIITNVSAKNCGQTVLFSGSGSTLTLNVSDNVNNTYLGNNCGKSGGQNNTGVGKSALSQVVGAVGNVGIGRGTIGTITGVLGVSGLSNTAVGDQTLSVLATGSYNLALGRNAGNNYTTSESGNICIANAGVLGESNVLRIGTQGTTNDQVNQCYIAGIVGVTVSNEEFVTINSSTGQLGVKSESGFLTQINGDTGSATPSGGVITIKTGSATENAGSSLTFSGSGSTLTLNSTDSLHNTLIGNLSGGAITSGQLNVGYGQTTLHALTSGSFNTALGPACLNFLLTGSRNIAIGNQAGSNYTGSESSNILLGNTGTTAESNVIKIGVQGSSAGQQNACYIAGIVGVTASNPQFVTINSATGQLGVSSGGVTTWSDASGTFSAVAGNGYFLTAASTPTLPASPSEGNIVSFVCDTSSTVTVTANTGQSIRIGSAISALAGTATSSTQGNSLTLVFRSSNSTWFSLGAPEGTWTVT